jgi:hypothetical protein
MDSISTRQKAGLVIAGLISVGNLPSAFFPTPEGDEGPPYGILVLGTVLGVIGLIAVVAAWRGSRVGLRVAAGVLILGVLIALPAFFVDVPAGIKAMVGVVTLLTIAAVVLMFSPARRPSPVLD